MRKSTGISLLLLIFLSLCLMTFALLSLSGARADERLSQKSADRTTEYYAAVTEANKLLTMINEQLALLLKDAEHSDDPQRTFLSSAAAVKESLPGGISWVASDDSDTFDLLPNADKEQNSFLSFTVPIKENQVLLAALTIQYPLHPQDTMYQITAWQVVNTDDWEADTMQNLYQRPDSTDSNDKAQ